MERWRISGSYATDEYAVMHGREKIRGGNLPKTPPYFPLLLLFLSFASFFFFFFRREYLRMRRLVL